MKSTSWIIVASIIIFVSVLISGNAFSPRIITSHYFSKKGDIFLSSERYDTQKAERYLRMALIFNGKEPFVHYQLARICMVQNDLESAKKEIDLELKYHPENKRAYYIRGLIDGYLKNYTEAQDDFRTFIDWAPDEWAGHMDLSWVYINDGKFQEALDTDNKGLEKFPEHIWLMSNKGLALYKLGRYDEARDVLARDKELAKNLKPDDWKKAYPGNDPNGAEEGVKEIKGAISYNLTLTYKKLDDTTKYLEEVDYYRSLFPAGDARRGKIYDTL